MLASHPAHRPRPAPFTREWTDRLAQSPRPLRARPAWSANERVLAAALVLLLAAGVALGG